MMISQGHNDSSIIPGWSSPGFYPFSFNAAGWLLGEATPTQTSKPPAAQPPVTTQPPATTTVSPAPVTTPATKPTQSATSTSTATSSPVASSSPSATPRALNTKELIMSSTTSTRDSGLMDVLQPLFEQRSGYKLKPIYVGTGAAMTMGQQGNADVLLVHAPDSEVKFMADGWGINRKLVMHNDFIIVGPSKDPAGIKDQTSAVAALKKIADAKATFYSRGDNSGTDQLEKKLWEVPELPSRMAPLPIQAGILKADRVPVWDSYC